MFLHRLLGPIVVLALLSFHAPSASAQVSEPAEDPASKYLAEGYRLVWADEFDQDGPPDPTKWTYERGFVRNEELQWYQEDNARCENGLLVIEGRRERKPNPNHRPGGRDWRTSREYAEYTSSCLITQGLHEWKFGRFEMRAKIDTRPGLWPAWWMLGVRGRWPANGEIDIMEYYRGVLLANAAWLGEPTAGGRGSVRWDDVKIPLEELGPPDWSDQFHVWRMDWDEESLELSVDGRVLNTVDLRQAANPPGTVPERPFHQPHYMLLNLAIGGQSGGDPSATPFPAQLVVDYVRVYQKP